jgi:hypothetical protein
MGVLYELKSFGIIYWEKTVHGFKGMQIHLQTTDNGL